MAKQRGRKPLPKSAKHSVRVMVNLRPADGARLKQAAREGGYIALGDYIRDQLLAALRSGCAGGGRRGSPHPPGSGVTAASGPCDEATGPANTNKKEEE